MVKLPGATDETVIGPNSKVNFGIALMLLIALTGWTLTGFAFTARFAATVATMQAQIAILQTSKLDAQQGAALFVTRPEHADLLAFMKDMKADLMAGQSEDRRLMMQHMSLGK